MPLFEPVTNFALGRSTRNQSLDQIADLMAATGQTLELIFGAAADSDHNRRLINHIVGIERWGQQRLRTALGEPLVIDEYDGYRPPRAATLPELQADFAATRRDTVALTCELGAAGAEAVGLPHNQIGNLSVRSWLGYLNIHANWEAKKLK